MFQWFIRFPSCNHWIHKISVPFRENSTVLCNCVSIYQCIYFFAEWRHVVVATLVINVLIHCMMKNPHFIPVSSLKWSVLNYLCHRDSFKNVQKCNSIQYIVTIKALNLKAEFKYSKICTISSFLIGAILCVYLLISCSGIYIISLHPEYFK